MDGAKYLGMPKPSAQLQYEYYLSLTSEPNIVGWWPAAKSESVCHMPGSLPLQYSVCTPSLDLNSLVRLAGEALSLG